MADTKSAFMCVLVFLLIILSYTPLKMEIHNTAINETLTNAVVVFLDTWFGLFWIVLGMVFLGLAFYYATK